jgi:16S rRNA (uracil1498-N3)-methyltransferase
VTTIPFFHLDAGALRSAGRGDERPLPETEAHHLRTVLRLADGAPLVVSDGEGRWVEARLIRAGVEVAGEVRHEPRPDTAVEVVHGLPRGRKLDEVVRVLTELGVDRIAPVHADRSPVELRGARADKAAARWRAVARAAAGQSRRARLPQVAPPGDLDEEAERFDGGLGILAHPAADDGLGALLRGPHDGPVRVVIAVGPESGWSDREVERWREHGGRVAHLGPTVLRTEHAAAAICAAVGFQLGRLG